MGIDINLAIDRITLAQLHTDSKSPAYGALQDALVYLGNDLSDSSNSDFKQMSLLPQIAVTDQVKTTTAV